MIYVVTHANSVSVIEGRTNTVTATLPVDNGPWAIAGDSVANDLCRQSVERQGDGDRWPHDAAVQR
jgi:YVTN family beta-propeller protein